MLPFRGSHSEHGLLSPELKNFLLSTKFNNVIHVNSLCTYAMFRPSSLVGTVYFSDHIAIGNLGRKIHSMHTFPLSTASNCISCFTIIPLILCTRIFALFSVCIYTNMLQPDESQHCAADTSLASSIMKKTIIEIYNIFIHLDCS